MDLINCQNNSPAGHHTTKAVFKQGFSGVCFRKGNKFGDYHSGLNMKPRRKMVIVEIEKKERIQERSKENLPQRGECFNVEDKREGH